MRVVLLAVVTLLVSVLAACSPPAATEPVTVCATQATPPIVVDDERCPGPGVQVYSAPAGDVDEDDWPVIGEPLDGDFWNLADQLDLDEAHRSGRTAHHTRITVTKPPRSSVVAKVPTLKPTRTTTRSTR